MGAFLQISILSCRPFTVDKFPHTYFIVQKTRLIPAHLYLLTIALEEAFYFYTLFYLVGATLVINTTLSTCFPKEKSFEKANHVSFGHQLNFEIATLLNAYDN